METIGLDFSLLFDDDVATLVTESNTDIPSPSDLADGTWWG